VLRRFRVSPADREDLVQEIFVVVHRRLHEYDGRASFRSWLYGICARMVSGYRRSAHVRRQRSYVYDAVDECEGHGVDDPERTLELRRACLLLEGLLVRLDDDKRAVFVLFEIEGQSMTQIAEALGCPLQTAYSRLHAARKAMRALVYSASLRDRRSAAQG
jgi:RNA polymerase sigma-70 factor (ECF subfamily)